MYILGYPILSIVSILDGLLMIYGIIVFVACVLSWVNPDKNSPIVRILDQLTIPVFVYFKRFIPSFGNIDLTPFAVLLAIVFIRSGILPVFETFAQGLIK